MLAMHYRVWVQNDTGVPANVAIFAERWKFDSNGALEYEGGGAKQIYSNAALATGSGEGGTTQNNGTDLFLGGDMQITVILGGSPSGDLTVLLQRSVDGGTTWPSDNAGHLVSSINFTASGTKVRVEPFS